MRRALVIAAALAAVTLSLPGGVEAARKEKKVDLIWTHPAFAGFGVDRIAMLPVSTFDNSISTERTVEAAFSPALKETGYRWVSVSTTRDLLRVAGGGSDSLLKLVRKSVLQNLRVDSLLVPGLCARLRADAILAVRVDQWEQNLLEWDQSGKPSTSIQIKAALMDSTGTLLWSASGSQTGEGPYRDANANPIGVSGGALARTPITGQGGAPSFPEVLAPLVARWTPQFPAKAQPAKTP